MFRQLAQNEGHRFPKAVEAVLKETYVDNVHSGAYSIEEGLEKIRQIDNFLLIGFPLQEWVASDNELLADISESRRAAVSSLSFEEEPVFRALGLVAIANRFIRIYVTLVQETIPKARWHHVSGEDNPADCASRGLSPQQLTMSPDHLWWQGPSWLKQHSRFWPSTIPHLNEEMDLEERKKIVATVQRAFCQRAIVRMKSRDMKSFSVPLTPLEIETSRLFWIKTIQRAYFDQEIRQLENDGILPRSSPLFRLVPFLDNGLLRLGGRLQTLTYQLSMAALK
ncbi:hypothetical protein RF55_15334 [Lasius niger]|uniref:Uncharacterized protein n=1 Tax=Lasius niger TaxID=67767 RepID=A0A0J7K5U9_LASNI|nr:hypothetical protein RF55_15334 [Lasius niger]